MPLSTKLIPILRDAVGNTCFLNGKMIPVEALHKLASAAEEANTSSSTFKDPQIVYEVVRWRNNKPGWCEGHAMRMAESLHKFNYHPDLTAEKAKAFFPQAFRAMITAVANQNNVIEQNVKIIVWRQEQELLDASNTIISSDEQSKIPQLNAEENPASKMPPSADLLPSDYNWTAFLIKSFYPPEEWYVDNKENSGVTVAVMSAQRHDPHSKVPMPELRNRAQKIQKDFECFECLLRRPDDGVITEGSRSNFLLVMKKESTESTTDKDYEELNKFENCEIVEALDQDVLKGITRTAIDKICQLQNIPLTKRNIQEEDIKKAVGLALSGTSLGCLPVKNLVTFEDHDETKQMTKKIVGNGSIPPILKELQKQYAAYRDGEKKFPDE